MADNFGCMEAYVRGPHVRDHGLIAEVKEVTCNWSTEWRGRRDLNLGWRTAAR